MQGRLSPMVDGKIQAFPWNHWQEEFVIAGKIGFQLMEWTLDHKDLCHNPLLTTEGQKLIAQLMDAHAIRIPSLTGDCFMQAPFYKKTGETRDALLYDLQKIIKACSSVGIQNILIPLVDNGRLENDEQKDSLLAGLESVWALLETKKIRISFESDYGPDQLAAFIEKFDPALFGITYDIGNSAALGYDPWEEIAAYGHRIINVHVKDRLLGGTTVPLSTGDADIPAALEALHRAGYQGNYMLQTARATDGDHAGVLAEYREMVAEWLTALRKSTAID